MSDARKRAEEMAQSITYTRMPGLESRIADTLEPLLLELEAARKMRDRIKAACLRADPALRSTVETYDALRKKNEGEKP